MVHSFNPNNFLKVECFAFAPPSVLDRFNKYYPVTLIRISAESCSPYVHSFITQDDIVPRLGVHPIHRLKYAWTKVNNTRAAILEEAHHQGIAETFAEMKEDHEFKEEEHHQSEPITRVSLQRKLSQLLSDELFVPGINRSNFDSWIGTLYYMLHQEKSPHRLWRKQIEYIMYHVHNFFAVINWANSASKRRVFSYTIVKEDHIRSRSNRFLILWRIFTENSLHGLFSGSVASNGKRIKGEKVHEYWFNNLCSRTLNPSMLRKEEAVPTPTISRSVSPYFELMVKGIQKVYSYWTQNRFGPWKNSSHSYS